MENDWYARPLTSDFEIIRKKTFLSDFLKNAQIVDRWTRVGRIDTSRHQYNLALCPLAQVEAMGSANLLQLNATELSIIKI